MGGAWVWAGWGVFAVRGCGPGAPWWSAEAPPGVELVVPPPAPAPLPPASSIGASPAAPATASIAEPTAACATAFADQRQLYVDAGTAVHPAREAAFLRTCATMPPAYQRCASPLHQIEHEAECAAVHEDEDRTAKAAWHRTFELLSDPRPDLPPAAPGPRSPER